MDKKNICLERPQTCDNRWKNTEIGLRDGVVDSSFIIFAILIYLFNYAFFLLTTFSLVAHANRREQ